MQSDADEFQAPIAVTATTKKPRTRARRKVDTTQKGEIADDLAQAEKAKSKAEALTTRRSTRMRKRSDKVENNRRLRQNWC